MIFKNKQKQNKKNKLENEIIRCTNQSQSGAKDVLKCWNSHCTNCARDFDY